MRTSLVFKNILNVQPMARFVGIMICILFLLVGFVPAAFSFGNGQAASLVIGQSSFTTGANALTQAGLSQPLGVTFDSGGNLWVMDSLNHRVLEYVPPFSNGMSASHVIGQPDFTTSTIKIPATQSGTYFPEQATFDSGGDLWVADGGYSRVLEYQPPFSDGMPANLVIGQPDFTTAGSGGGPTGLFAPAGLVFDSHGNLWIADGGNNRVLEYVPPFSNGMSASHVIGQSILTTSTAAATRTGLRMPEGVEFDSVGDLWVTDELNNRTLEYVPPFADGMQANLVIGEPDFTTTTGGISQNSLTDPHTLAFASGNLWVVDGANNQPQTGTVSSNRLLGYLSPFSDGMPASLVIGQSSFTTNYGATTQSGLNLPVGVAVDSQGNLWVSDGGNNRVLEFIGPTGPFDFAISNSGDITAFQGSSGTNTVSVPLAGGTTQPVTLSCTGGLPVGASCGFSPAATGSPTFSAGLTVSTSTSTPPGTYTITVTGTGGARTHTSLFTLTVKPFDFSIYNSGDISAFPGSSGSTTVSVSLLGGPTQQVTLTVSGLPSGSSSSFSGGCSGRPSCTASPSFSSTLTILLSSSTPRGTYGITVTGTGGGQIHTTTLNLFVIVSGSLGGTEVPIDKLGLVAPYLGLAAIALGTFAASVFLRRFRPRRD